MDEEKRRKLEAELEELQALIRDTLAFIDEDSHLTDEGLAAREVLRRELEENKRDMEAVRQEHSPDRISGLEEQLRRRAAEAEQERAEEEGGG